VKKKTETILYLEFYDHSSSTNSWQEYKEILADLNPENNIMKVVGKLLEENEIAYSLTTMWGEECAGSGHSIIKSTIERELRWEVPIIIPKKPFLRHLQ
jgi:hypothetical protein